MCPIIGYERGGGTSVYVPVHSIAFPSVFQTLSIFMVKPIQQKIGKRGCAIKKNHAEEEKREAIPLVVLAKIRKPVKSENHA